MPDAAEMFERAEPDYNGWTQFEVYPWNGFWWWSACDDYGDHKGFREGPFGSKQAAYSDAMFETPSQERRDNDTQKDCGAGCG